VAFSYNPTHVAKVKIIEGYKWHPKEKHWSFPYSDVTNGDIWRYIRTSSHIPGNWEYIGTSSDTNKLSEIRLGGCKMEVNI